MQTEILLANKLLDGSNISIIDAARLIRNILDTKENIPNNYSNCLYCRKIIDLGINTYEGQNKSKTLYKALSLYVASKSSLGKESLKDIKYIGSRLFRLCPEMKNVMFTSLSPQKCQKWIETCFPLPSQFNKCRTFLSGFFSFAIKNKWLKENPISQIKAKKIKEKVIYPLTIEEILRLIKTVRLKEYETCAAAIGIMLWAGVRPKEVSRLRWDNIDFEENIITIHSTTSKTGGTRHIEILPVLKKWLLRSNKDSSGYICPPNWLRKWKMIRDVAGFEGVWINDVLRHTFASYHLKYFKNLIRLQSEMGHRDLNLLRTRYVNMSGISKEDAISFMNLHKTDFQSKK